MKMTSFRAIAKKLILIVLFSIPLAIMVTLLLAPFWSWLESASGIESVGHSGPSEWSYLAIYAMLVCLGLAWCWVLHKT